LCLPVTRLDLVLVTVWPLVVTHAGSCRRHIGFITVADTVNLVGTLQRRHHVLANSTTPLNNSNFLTLAVL